MAQARRRRADGDSSKERILEATARIAGERGYEGTSISLVSELSGLPASSIYWHFTGKDELIAAVIDRSFHQWMAALETPVAVPDGATGEQLFRLGMRHAGATIAQFPDFLRLGLMLVLERRPEEPTARRKFIEVRRTTADRVRMLYRATFAELEGGDIDRLVTVTMALADGFFVAAEAGEAELAEAFELLATAVLGTAEQLREAQQRRRTSPTKARRRA